MSKEVQINFKGIGFFGLLTIALIVLKLIGEITISWWWVFAPVWIPLAFVIFLIFIFGMIALFK